jgi:hypothetical protein
VQLAAVLRRLFARDEPANVQIAVAVIELAFFSGQAGVHV